ncbi:hypothetical protein EGJ86_19170 [Pseudomonas sp. o96-267]|uniref:hypothetical protein n=1 Tax=Pseudomonas sp. o96-267 TaxID=2479853 RepID=UPI000F774021|nr:MULTISPECIES: hypothetical protein [Pseudomonas]MDH0959110.1 hypothetical protein [Pseudomonas chengduensis]MDV5863582.1 hypothetical protein [Pseudomonas mendocina]RRV31695.1 hypothetical protein EGJ86_19170 [Pseudomonas sp. o96-267]
MELEDKLISATNKTFGKFTELLAKVDPVAALVVTGAVGAVAVTVNFGAEYLHQQEIFREGGIEALKAYHAQGASGTLDFIAKGISNALPSATQNRLALSTLGTFTVPVIASVSTLIAGRFQKLKQEIKTLEQGGRQDKTLEAESDRPRGATRISASERFNMSIDSLSRKITEVQHQEESQKSGPKL